MKPLKTLERYKKELAQLEKQRSLIDEKKKKLWQAIKILKNSIDVYNKKYVNSESVKKV